MGGGPTSVGGRGPHFSVRSPGTAGGSADVVLRVGEP